MSDREKIKEALKMEKSGHNSMGADERFYHPYYMVGMCFPEEALGKMSDREIENLVALAGFAGDVFY